MPQIAADAEDVAQEAFIKAYRALPSFRGDSAFDTWLYRIAHNAAEQLDYHPPDERQVERFKAVLESRGVSAYVRRARGRDIYAACGQLAAKQEPNPVRIAA